MQSSCVTKHCIGANAFPLHSLLSFCATGLTGGGELWFDLRRAPCVRLWPVMLNVVQPDCVQAAPLISDGALPPDERTRWASLLDWNCIKEKGEKKGEGARLSPDWGLLHGCLAWTDERVNLVWQRTTMSNDSGAAHAFTLPLHGFTCDFFLLKRGLICSTASATLFVSIVCGAAGC